MFWLSHQGRECSWYLAGRDKGVAGHFTRLGAALMPPQNVILVPHKTEALGLSYTPEN